MDQRTDSRVRDWDARPFSGGYDGLRELADGGFSGAVVTVGDTWLFMLNGRIIGVFQGRIEDFEAGDGTVYRAPDPSLPLLFTMQERGGEQQAKYYTNDTPISQAHQQLSDASFTGFIELSENVLSGDYYVVYYGGRSMSCAFVGASERLLTGDEAFQQADDEVGIYEVRSVDIDVVELPDPDPEPAGAGATGGAGPGGDGPPASGESPGRDAGSATGQGGDPAGRDPDPTGRDPEPAGRDAGQPTGQDAAGGDTAADAGRRDPGGERDSAGGRDSAGERGSGGGRDPADERGSAGAAGQDPAGSGAGRSTDDAAQAGGSSRDEAARGPADAGRPDASRQEPGEAGAESRDDRQRRDEVPEREPASDPETREHSPDPEPDTEPGGRSGGRPTEETEERPSEARAGNSEPVESGSDASERAGRDPADRGADASTDTRASEPDHRGTGASEPDQHEAGASEPDQHEAERSTGADTAADAGGTPERQDAGDRSHSGGRAGAAGSRGPAASTGGTASMQPEPKPPELFDEIRRVPSLDPDRTGEDAVDDGAADAGGVSTTGAGTDSTGTTAPTGTEPSSADRRSPEAATGGAVRTSGPSDESGGEEAVDAAVADEAAGELRSKLADREQRIEELEANLADLRVQRDGLRDERDGLREEVEELEAEIVDLEEEIQTLRDRLNEGTEGRRRLDEEEALRGTNLFVRYASKSGGTLEDAHAGDVDPGEVNENLRLEHHTQFEADNVAVDGRPFDQFLRDSIYRQYVEWLVRTLLYEVRDTGNVKQLRELYDALPQVDRAELLGDVQVEYTEEGETYREPRQFDVVLRDRMGDPLLVADLNDSRNPASEDMMEGVVRNATDVKESHDSLAGAMLVTASFFEPGALETADEAAGGGGLMGGSSKASFVKLSRKRGYHLLLVETRDGEFHVNVPEL